MALDRIPSLLFCFSALSFSLFFFSFSHFPAAKPHRHLSSHQQHLLFIQHPPFHYFLHSSDFSHQELAPSDKQTTNRVQEEVRGWQSKNTKQRIRNKQKKKVLLCFFKTALSLPLFSPSWSPFPSSQQTTNFLHTNHTRPNLTLSRVR